MVNENYSGVEIVIPDDCGNAPRRITIVNFYKAMANKDEEYIVGNTINEVAWEVIGKKKMTGINELTGYFNELMDKKIIKIKIYTVLTHGRFGAVNGSFIFEEKPRVDFCDMYTFSSTAKSGKVKEVASYVIESE